MTATDVVGEIAGERLDFGARFLGRELHGMAHVEQRARAERAHVVGRDIGVALHDPDGFRRNVEQLADDLGHSGVGALPHIDGVGVEHDAAVGA